MQRLKKLLKSLSLLLPSRRCELLLYELLAATERNAVRTNQILLSQRAPDFIFELTSGPRMRNGQTARMYAPQAGEDYIQTIIATRHDFFSIEALERTREWIKPGSHIVDIGGHIGNHAVYWAGVAGADRIYSFEPNASMSAIQATNIQINQLGDIIKAFPLALGLKPGRGRISIPDAQNTGSIQIIEDADGECGVESLDSLFEKGFFSESPEISFVKIDVEGFEAAVLRGGRNFLAQYKPLLLIEVFDRKKDEVFDLLITYGYRQVDTPDEHDYLFAHSL